MTWRPNRVANWSSSVEPCSSRSSASPGRAACSVAEVGLWCLLLRDGYLPDRIRSGPYHRCHRSSRSPRGVAPWRKQPRKSLLPRLARVRLPPTWPNPVGRKWKRRRPKRTCGMQVCMRANLRLDRVEERGRWSERRSDNVEQEVEYQVHDDKQDHNTADVSRIQDFYS